MCVSMCMCVCVCAVWPQFLVQNLVDRAVLTKVCSKGTRYSSQLAGQVLSESPSPRAWLHAPRASFGG